MMKITLGMHVRHVKRGSTYVVESRAAMQIGPDTLSLLDDEESESACNRLENITYIAYRSLHDGTLWFRPESEFTDGRFEEIAS